VRIFTLFFLLLVETVVVDVEEVEMFAMFDVEDDVSENAASEMFEMDTEDVLWRKAVVAEAAALVAFVVIVGVLVEDVEFLRLRLLSVLAAKVEEDKPDLICESCFRFGGVSMYSECDDDDEIDEIDDIDEITEDAGDGSRHPVLSICCCLLS
jgi:hypothetical protein